MLALKRRVGESVLVGNGIKLTLVEVAAGHARVRIHSRQIHQIELQEGQYAEVGKDVFLSVAQAKAGGASFGISAPPSMRIMREELLYDPETALRGTIWQGQK